MIRLIASLFLAGLAVWFYASTIPASDTPPPPAPPVNIDISSDTLPSSKPIALVFGAGLASSATPSLVLQDRLDTAYDLYTDEKVDTLLLSGDSTLSSHDEVGVMKAYLIKKGIPEDKLSVDPQGVDTYTTCLHAKNDFGAHDVILVTQGFHMPRAQYLCEGVGLTVQVTIADRRTYDPVNDEREKRAMTKAWLQLNTGIDAQQLDQLEKIAE
ncbi:MAG: YdcF family protein [bacterium]|nr:YdcF family protein [bacterium]